ncbi:hypothetical protein ABZ896_43185 [Streptomyces sp. NPDC047072]|uniref:DNA polymerase Y family protein n=1 Tax=Streptomyces sp. NPDC047072 TaxID=3154809 RepID=UPI0033F8D691
MTILCVRFQPSTRPEEDLPGLLGLLGLLGEFTPVVEALPPDGALADLWGAERRLGRSAVELASAIRVRALALHGTDCTIGVGPGPTLARMALEAAEPGVTRAVSADTAADFLAGRPVGALPGIGAGAVRALAAHGLDTLGRVAAAPLAVLQRLIGEVAGRELHERANGVDRGRVVPNRFPRRCLTAERPFDRDEHDPGRYRRALLSAAEELAARLCALDEVCRALTLTVHCADRPAITRGHALREPAAHPPVLAGAACDLYETLGLRWPRLRSLTLHAEELGPAAAARQLAPDSLVAGLHRVEESAGRWRAGFGARVARPRVPV